jgi:hypothetical protein
MPFNALFSWVIKKRIHQIDLFRKFPLEVQDELFFRMLKNAANTAFGKQHKFHKITDYNSFKNSVPLQTYEELKTDVDKLIAGEKNLLWPGTTSWFAKSSGTTSNRSKFIPVTKDSLFDCHYKGGKDLLALYYTNYPDRKLYNAKHLIIGGSAKINPIGINSYLGDLSAIIVKNLPWWAEIRRTPSREIALMDDWEKKLDKMAKQTIKEDVCIIAGVPSWTLVLCNRILEITGKNNLKEVWPNLELFMHGGVSFQPYKKEFERLIPDKSMHYIETYNASEGFFGIQDNPDSDDLLLMLDYGIFYEFIPMPSFDGIASKTVLSLAEVELNTNYALVISTNGGLWRYILGDTITFTSLLPYKFKITGRTQSFINCFGEEVIVDNTEKAIAFACTQTDAILKEYTVGPIFMEDQSKGGHEWLIEFAQAPKDLKEFTNALDQELRNINSDYDAKRTKDLALEIPSCHVVPTGTFDRWLQGKGKLGGQNKVPRLSNDRRILEEILTLIEKE